MEKCDPTKIAFIVCTNNEQYMQECRYYIDRLDVPEGMSVAVIPIEDPESMTSGYQAAMLSSDAKYKIYLHQDMFLVHKGFLRDLLACFAENDKLGMIGVAGTEHLRDADAWRSLDIGGCISVGTFRGMGSIAVRPEIRNPQGRYQEVEFIDGMLLATAYDLPWDERIRGFHFYDVSQCERFRRAGYQIAVVRQEELWSFHDFGPLNLATYTKNQKAFCALYGYPFGEGQDNTEIYELCGSIAKVIKEQLDAGAFSAVTQILKEVDNAIFFDQTLLTAYFLLEIHALEQQAGTVSFFDNVCLRGGFGAMEDKWLKLRLQLIRTAFGDETSDRIADRISRGEYSPPAVIVAMLHNIPQEDLGILDTLGKKLEKENVLSTDVWEQMILLVKEYERSHMPSADEL